MTSFIYHVYVIIYYVSVIASTFQYVKKEEERETHFYYNIIKFTFTQSAVMSTKSECRTRLRRYVDPHEKYINASYIQYKINTSI